MYSGEMNIYDKKIIFVIALLSLGVIGGALQPIRLFSILTIPLNIRFIAKNIKETFIFVTWFFGMLWLLYGMLALSWAPDIVSGRIELLYIFIHYNLIFTIFRYASKSYNPLMAISRGWLICVCITSLFGIYELITNQHFYTSIVQTEQSDLGIALNGIQYKKFVATLFNNYNEYITLLSFSLPFVFFLFFKIGEIKKQIFLWIIVSLIFVFISINGSRGGMLCYIIAFFFFLKKYNLVVYKYKKTVSILVCLILSSFILSFREMIFGDISERLMNTSSIEDFGRSSIYNKAFELYIESNYMGVGPWGYQEIVGFAPHNLWLEILSQYGVVIFIPLMILLIIVFNRIIRLSKNTNGSCIFFVLIIASFINSGYLHFPFTWIYFASILTYYMVLNNKFINYENSYKYPKTQW